ncbi:Helicase associated domain protein [Streptomyces nigrescens]
MKSVRPLARETTLSFINRLAGRFGASADDLIAEFFAPGNRKAPLPLNPDGEVYLNAEARSRLASLTRVPEEHLRRALPAWAGLDPVGYYDAGPALTFYGAGSIAPTGTACASCTAARTGRTEPARLYMEAHQRVCVRHQVWLPVSQDLVVEGLRRRQLSVVALPEITQAHQRHTKSLCRSPQAADAYEVARAIVTTWWDAAWPQEAIWPQRLDSLMAANLGATLPPDMARDVVSYPDTVTLAALLSSRFWQHRVLADTGSHQPHTPADVPMFTHELASRLRRSWLSSLLADSSSGPLVAWLRACWRSRAGEREGTKSMWWVAPSYRAPKAVSSSPNQSVSTASSTDAESSADTPAADGGTAQGFARGLALARAFSAEHGHLCIPYRHKRDGFALGLWLANQRAIGPQLSPERSRALSELDVCWNPPWSTLWQRLYLRSRQHAVSASGIRPEQGFPGTSENLGTWLYRQCQLYGTLHPQQQKLLSQIGITPESAERARPRRRSMAEARDQTMAHARTYWNQHGHLCAKASDVHPASPSAMPWASCGYEPGAANSTPPLRMSWLVWTPGGHRPGPRDGNEPATPCVTSSEPVLSSTPQVGSPPSMTRSVNGCTPNA